jgi:hypothetical protein
MTLSNIIDTLAEDLKPAPKGWFVQRLATGLTGAAILVAGIVFMVWGARPDFAAAVMHWPFWAKLGFTGSLAIVGVAAVARLARPGLTAPHQAWGVAGLVAAMTTLAALQYAGAPAASRPALLFGGTARTCPWLIMALATPFLAGGLWAFRAMAPTRLTSAGAALGLVSGAGAATLYALSCDEAGMPFVLVWYGLGIAVPTIVGAILGRLLLRW